MDERDLPAHAEHADLPIGRLPATQAFCLALRGWMSGGLEPQALLRPACELLCREPRVRALRPEEFLLLLKAECLGIARESTMSSSAAVSDSDSFRYHRALDVLWSAWFGLREGSASPSHPRATG